MAGSVRPVYSVYSGKSAGVGLSPADFWYKVAFIVIKISYILLQSYATAALAASGSAYTTAVGAAC